MADIKKRRVEEPMDQGSGDSGTSVSTTGSGDLGTLVSQDESTEETGSDASSDGSTARKYSRHLIQYPDHEFKVHRKGIHRLGSGSFGDVCKYHHEKLSVVAIKQFYITGDDKKVMKTWDMVLREANILCRFHHQNIVEFLGITKWTNAVGIVMEHVDGGNLQTLLADDNQSDLKWNTRIQIANGLVSALSYIHNYGEKKIFCHGDIKPENVLLTKALQVKLADFGSAALRLATGALTTTLDFVPSRQFTLVYVAPEFLKDTAVTRHPAMDMYSFGMVLYELISRRAPYSDCSLPATVPGLVLAKIKPTDRLLDNAENQVESKDDLFIFNLLKSLMKRCWNDDPASRPDSKTVEMEVSSYLSEITVESLDSTSSDHEVNRMVYEDTDNNQKRHKGQNQYNNKFSEATSNTASTETSLFHKPTAEEIFQSPDPYTLPLDVREAPVLLKRYGKSLKQQNFKEADAIKANMITLIASNSSATADDLISVGLEFQKQKRYLDSIAIFDAAAASSQELNYPEDDLRRIQSCVRELRKANQAMVEDDASMETIVKDHVIPLMREKLRHAEVATNVPEKVRCVQTSWIAYHISKSQALINLWKEEEQTLRDAVTDMKKVFGNDVGKENDFLFGRLRDDLDVACERSSQPQKVAIRHQYVTETVDYDEEQEPDDFYDQQDVWDAEPPQPDDFYDPEDDLYNYSVEEDFYE